MSGSIAEPTSIDGNPTFQSIADHRSSSKSSFSQAAGVKAGIVESKAPTSAFGDSKGVPCCAATPIVANASLLFGTGIVLGASSGRRIWIRETICSTAALVLRTGSWDPICRSSRRAVQSLSKQPSESWVLSCTVASASTKHALSR